MRFLEGCTHHLGRKHGLSGEGALSFPQGGGTRRIRLVFWRVTRQRMAKRRGDSSVAVRAPPCKRFLGEECRRLPYSPRPQAKRKMDLAEERTGEGARQAQRPRFAVPAQPVCRARSADGGLKRPRVDAGVHGEQEAGPDPGAEGESRRRGSTEPIRRCLYGSQDQQDGEECWQYNSFHYWRVPLPNIDLSEIFHLDEENITEFSPASRPEGAEVEMES